MNDMDRVLIEAMGEISKTIDNAINLQEKVKQSNDQKAIDTWNGQILGLKKALEIVSEVRINNISKK